jgi:hypothetical protein
VRALGGRFLELDERSGIYHDIGNKKAMEKTSQALREGQTEIRRGILRGEGKAAGLPDGAPENCSSSNFDSYQNNNVPPPNVDHEMSPQGYFDFSCKVLQSLYVKEDREFATSDATEDTLQQMYNAANVTPTTPTSAYVHAPTPSSANENSVDMAMFNDQFPGVFQTQSQVDPLLQAPIGRFTGMSSTFRPSCGDYRHSVMSGMSLESVFSINTLRQLIESTQSENSSSEYRDTIQSVVNAEVMELFQKTMPQLEEIENGAMAEDDSDHENGEVDLFHEDPSAELDFRLTDVSAWDGFDAQMSRMSIDDKTGETADV